MDAKRNRKGIGIAVCVIALMALTGCIQSAGTPGFKDLSLGRMTVTQPAVSASGGEQQLLEYGVFYSTDRDAVVQVDQSEVPTDGVNIGAVTESAPGTSVVRRTLARTVAESTPGTLAVTLKGLRPGTTYYTRFYAIARVSSSGYVWNTLFPVASHTTSDPTLKRLSVSRGSFSPSFDSGVYAYTNTLSRTTASSRITVAPTLDGSSVAMRVDGGAWADARSKLVSVARRTSKVVDILVTAPDGITAQYTVTVKRK
jgi:hypothetical protein